MSRQEKTPFSACFSLTASVQRARVRLAGWSSLVARQAHNLKVVGSNPTPATPFVCFLVLREVMVSALPKTMAGVLLTGYGGLDKLEYREDLPVPHPRADEILVKLSAAAINNTDINTRSGWYDSAVTCATSQGAEGGFASRKEASRFEATSSSKVPAAGQGFGESFVVGFCFVLPAHPGSGRLRRCGGGRRRCLEGFFGQALRDAGRGRMALSLPWL